MTLDVPVRAIALGLLAARGRSPACASHVDVGFTSEGGARAASDAGEGARGFQDMTSDSGAPCVIVTSCENGESRQRTYFADWRTDEPAGNRKEVAIPKGIDLATDPNNCGRCDQVCSSAERCAAGHCTR